MFGKHSMSMPALKNPARSPSSITAEDDDISGLRCSIISRRGDLDENASPPAPKKFVKTKSSPETTLDFDMCTISDTSDANTQASNHGSKREPCSPIDVSKLVFDSLPSDASELREKQKPPKKSAPAFSEQPKPAGRGGKKLFSASMGSIQMKKVRILDTRDRVPAPIPRIVPRRPSRRPMTRSRLRPTRGRSSATTWAPSSRTSTRTTPASSA